MQRIKSIWKLRRHCRLPRGAARMNCLAALIGLVSLVVLALNFQATPAVSGLGAAALAGQQLAAAPASVSAAGDVSVAGLAGLSLEDVNQRIQGAIHGSRLALQLHVAMLELGKHRIEAFPDYTATFIKQERLEGEELQTLQTIQLKLRHQPFGVYMKWLEGDSGDVGQEVLYVDGQYDNKMQVKLGGKKGEILPRLKLDPGGSVAMGKARHPVTEMGLLQLADLIIKFRKRDLSLNEGVRWEMLADQKILDRDCHCFVIEYSSKEIEPTYRKSITYIDRELLLPICVRNFGWPTEEVPADCAAGALDEQTLIEFYGYKDLSFESRLADTDFDKANSAYRFRR